MLWETSPAKGSKTTPPLGQNHSVISSASTGSKTETFGAMVISSLPWLPHLPDGLGVELSLFSRLIFIAQVLENPRRPSLLLAASPTSMTCHQVRFRSSHS